MADPASYRPENIPDEPGVYRFFNEKDEVIYVGKARSLKNRINSYFQKNVGEKTYRMIHAASRVDWTLVRSEVEALQLEFTWIKEENPAFNVQFKDDKSYPYLALTMDEKYPRLLITRRAKQKGVTYFGPFTHAWALRSTFDVLLKLFPVRSCSNSNFERAQRAKRPCLLGDIGKCTAPCVDRISESEHRVLAQRLGEFISDGSADITQALRDQMAEAAKMEEFERAGKLRDQYRRFGIDDKEKFDDTRAMHHVITRRFKRYLAEKDLDLNEIELSGGARPKFAYPPQLVIVDGGKGQVNAAARAFAELGITDIALVGLAKRLEEIWFADQSYPVILDRHSEALYLVQRIRDEAHRFAITFHRSKRSKLMLESLLDEIDNLGEVRRAVLLEHFGSIAALSKASFEQIAALPGIGPKSAESIVSSLANSESSYSVDTSTGEIVERS
ncbi:MAG: excinuclease ABC subunit UvrC [Actinobacteria bacterium]|nr:excinuclease ABC subunit UvrC [Actinomycetota bacterium]